jgi:DNA-directed RNA polymerase specialized sigma24 family protein
MPIAPLTPRRPTKRTGRNPRRRTPDERKVIPPSERAWAMITGEVPVPLSEGEGNLTELLYVWLREHLTRFTQRRLEWEGRPLAANFRWVGSGTFHGRTVADLASEMEGEVFEAAGYAIDRHRPEKGPLVPYIKLTVRHRLTSALCDWNEAMSSVNENREDHVSLDDMKEQGAELSYLDPHDQSDAPTVEQAMAVTALEALDEIEERALTLFAEGQSYASIAEIMGFPGGKGQAYHVVQRARGKAQEALLA